MDPRSTRTKQWIREALLSLMEEIPYEIINIKAVTERAKTARTTFYLHYTSKDDVLADYLRELSSNYLLDLKGAVSRGEFTSTLPAELAFSLWKKEARVIRLLKAAGRLDLFNSCIEASIAETLDFLSSNGLMDRIPHEAHRYILDYLQGAHSTVLLRWLQSGCEPAPEKMAAFHIEMLGSMSIEGKRLYGPMRGFRFERDADPEGEPLLVD
ncbi:MAG: TetR/AcrR family transcriptional regulator [Spirochaetes bacterium]|nr:TetR/AcrR family transcriptional regulator [Spirochaetota bacterium]MBU1081240.1 TetR/AcrR family transcriptional regulator [Spirochaetota bacterium]